MSTSLRHSSKATYYQEMVTIEMCTIFSHQALTRTFDISPCLPVYGARRWALYCKGKAAKPLGLKENLAGSHWRSSHPPGCTHWRFCDCLLNRPVTSLYDFRTRLLKACECTYEGPLEHYLSCEITRDLSPVYYPRTKHCAEEYFRTYGFWDVPHRSTPMKPNKQSKTTNTRLSKDDCDSKTKPDFHLHYRGIMGSLGYLITMTRPDLAWSYLEISKYVQFPGKTIMDALQLNTSSNIFVTLWNCQSPTPVALAKQTNCGDGSTQIALATLILVALTPVTSSWWIVDPFLDNVSLSTCEAEFVAASQAGQEVIYLLETLSNFGYKCRYRPSINRVCCRNIWKKTHRLHDPDKLSVENSLSFFRVEYQLSYWFDWPRKPVPWLLR